MSQNSSRSTVTLAARAARQLHVMGRPGQKNADQTRSHGGRYGPDALGWLYVSSWTLCRRIQLPHGVESVDHVDDNFVFSLPIVADVRYWTYKLTDPGARGRAVYPWLCV